MRVLKITLVKNLNAYFPRPHNNIYYGVLFDEDAVHLTLKCFSAAIDGVIHFGTIYRFIKDDIKVEELGENYAFG